jgi:hypothetical protein
MVIKMKIGIDIDGTSLTVYPVLGLINYFMEPNLIINKN